MSLTEWAARKRIQVLGAELAEMTDEMRMWRRRAGMECPDCLETQAELADLRASSVVVRKKCEKCGGNGFDPEPTFDENGMPEYAPCPDCCDNGWQLAEGVELMECVTSHDHEAACGSMYLIPARLIDGEDT